MNLSTHIRLRDHYIGESKRIVDDILEYMEYNELPSILFSADFGKPYIQQTTHLFLLRLKIWIWT